MSAYYFKHPTTILVAGPTGSGKTEFVSRAIEQKIFYPMPTHMQWVYGERQVEIEAHHEDVEFLKDANIEDIYESLDPNDSNLLVIDDQMSRERKYIEKLFTQGSHHKNLTVIMLVQNLFQKELRTISLNSHYIVLMKTHVTELRFALLVSKCFRKTRDLLCKPMIMQRVASNTVIWL